MRDFWRALARNRLAVVGGVIVACPGPAGGAAPVIAPWDPNRPDVKKILEPPSKRHLFGTDQLGRDVLSRMLYGARVSLAVGFVSVGIAATIGILLGSAAGYHGGLIDATIMRLVDLDAGLPALLPAAGRAGVPQALDLDDHGRDRAHRLDGRGPPGARRVPGAEGARVRHCGRSRSAPAAFRIIWRHILPNAMAPVLVAMTLGIPAAILTESGLSFLGLGVQPPHATWGNILNEGKDAIELAWWLSVYPGLAILVTVLSYNLLRRGHSRRARSAPAPERRSGCLARVASGILRFRPLRAEVAELADAHV